MGILHIYKLWILLRKIVMYLVCQTFILVDFFVVKIDGSDVIVGTPKCFNIQTRHKFENFCLFSLNSTCLIQIQVRYFHYICNCVFSISKFLLWRHFHNFNSKKVNEDKLFCRQDTLQFFSGVSKEYKCVKHEIGTLIICFDDSLTCQICVAFSNVRLCSLRIALFVIPQTNRSLTISSFNHWNLH